MQKIERIPGFYGRQMAVESDINHGDLIGAFSSAKELPDCEQKLHYMRLIFQHYMEKHVYFGGVDAALCFSQDEQTACFEKMVRKSWENNRGDWAKMVLEKFPACKRRDELAEDAIQKYLASHNLYSARDVAKLIGRELTKEELEEYVTNNLLISFHSAEEALKMLGRLLTAEEIRMVFERYYKTSNYSGIFRFAKMLPEGQEKELHISRALKHFLLSGNSSEVSEICKYLGRKPTNSEEMDIFKIRALKNNGNISSSYVKSLAENPNNHKIFQDLARELAEKNFFHNALEIMKGLDDYSGKEQLLQFVGEKVLNGGSFEIIKSYVEIMKPCELRTKMIRYLLLNMKMRLDEERGVEEVLSIAKLLPKGAEKLSHLEKLFAVCKKLEGERDRSDHPVMITYDVVKELDACG